MILEDLNFDNMFQLLFKFQTLLVHYQSITAPNELEENEIKSTVERLKRDCEHTNVLLKRVCLGSGVMSDRRSCLGASMSGGKTRPFF